MDSWQHTQENKAPIIIRRFALEAFWWWEAHVYGMATSSPCFCLCKARKEPREPSASGVHCIAAEYCGWAIVKYFLLPIRQWDTLKKGHGKLTVVAKFEYGFCRVCTWRAAVLAENGSETSLLVGRLKDELQQAIYSIPWYLLFELRSRLSPLSEFPLNLIRQ